MKKRVIFFIGGLNFGGMERVVFIAKELLAKEYDVKIVTLYQDAADYETKDEYYNLQVPPSDKKVYTFIKRFLKTITMIRTLKPDIVFSFGMYLNYLNILSNFCVKKRPCTIVGIRSYDWLTEPFLSAKSDKWIMRHADKVNSVSKLIAKDAETIWGIPKERNTVLYNPYDVTTIESRTLEAIDDFVFDNSKYYVITMGRLSNQKGYNHLIRAFNEVLKKINNIELLILGNGDKKQDIEAMILAYGLADNIKLLGGKENPYKYVKRSDLYVLSSLTEGFPNALSEAMCIGIPVVSVNCKSGPSEILFKQDNFNYENKNFYIGDYGILTREIISDRLYTKRVPSLEEISLADAICYAYHNRAQLCSIAERAKERMKDFTYDKFRTGIKKILDE